MLTTCPHCQAWFRVRAEQLTAANGVVTCGRCERVFSALASLVDESAFAAVVPAVRQAAAPPVAAVAPAPEPEPEPGPRPETSVEPAPAPPIVPPASELRADQAETASLDAAPEDEPADIAGDEVAADIPWEDEAPLPPPAETPWTADASVDIVEAAAEAPESAGVDALPAGAELVELAIPAEAEADNDETIVTRFLPTVPPPVPADRAAPNVADAPERDGRPIAAAATDDDADNLETVVTRVPAVAPRAAGTAAGPQDTAAPDAADDTFTPGATAFTRAYAAFEDSDTHGKELEFVFDDDLDATLHMARPDLRVDPVPRAEPAADVAPAPMVFDLSEPEVPAPHAEPLAADDAPASMVFDLSEPEAPASHAEPLPVDGAPVSMVFDLSDPEDTPPLVEAEPNPAPARADDVEIPAAIAGDDALDFDRLDRLPAPAAPADEEPLSALLPEDDAVLASLLDDPALSPEARAALTATIAAEAVAEAELEDAAEPAADGVVIDEAPVQAEQAGPSAALLAEQPAARIVTPPTDEVAPAPAASAGDDAAVPAALADDLRALEAPRRARRVGWTVFALVLAILGLAQGAFVARERLLTWMPAAAPAIDFLCTRLPCAERRVEGAVRLLARDVREHPQYRDALLVNATIVNSGTVPTPYPVIDLRLRDAAGNVLAARQFQPGEYLDQSIDQAQGMPAGHPIYVVLELAGDARAAVSFEFTFL